MSPWAHERSLFRIRYPLRERPSLVVDGVAHEVVDCCEGGIRFVGGRESWATGSTLEGLLTLRGGSTVAVRGRVLRVQEGEVAVALDSPGIPFAAILEEQRYLRSRYPMWPGDPEGD